MNKPSSPLSAQRGVSLIMAMVMLVGLMMGAVSLYRSIDTTTLVAGNMAYKHSTSLAAEAGVQAAFRWLEAQPNAVRYENNAAGGYCATQHPDDLNAGGWDPRVNWTACGVDPVLLAPDAAGNQVQYFIHRLCAQTKSPEEPGTAQTCSVPAAVTELLPPSKRNPPPVKPIQPLNVAYRVTVLVQAANGTRSYVQSTLTMLEN